MRPVINLRSLRRYLRKKTLQNGYIKQRSESNKIKKLDDYRRSLGCIPTSFNFQKNTNNI